MNFLATPVRRRVLFTCLYVSEGAPIGYLWYALPTRLKLSGVSLESITLLTSLLAIPWTLKFLWAPLVDVLRSRYWTLRTWILASQAVMGLALIPLLTEAGLELRTPVVVCLVVHAVAAATQDVAIDALCIQSTSPVERGRINGWMQAGMLLGRAALGGGGLILAESLGDRTTLGVLLVVIWFSTALVWCSRLHPVHAGNLGPQDMEPVDTELQETEPVEMEPPHGEHDRKTPGGVSRSAGGPFGAALVSAARRRSTWLGLLFALLAGGAYEGLAVAVGPLLIDLQVEPACVGYFLAVPAIAAMVLGSLGGGRLADRWGHRRVVVLGLSWLITGAVLVGVLLATLPGSQELAWLVLLALAGMYAGIGLYTAGSYALYMDLTEPRLAATQFSAFMGATNGCEAWSTAAFGRLATQRGYPVAIFSLAAASLLALPLLVGLRRAVTTCHEPLKSPCD